MVVRGLVWRKTREAEGAVASFASYWSGGLERACSPALHSPNLGFNVGAGGQLSGFTGVVPELDGGYRHSTTGLLS